MSDDEPALRELFKLIRKLLPDHREALFECLTFKRDDIPEK
jgi:hypothetical protein